MIPCLSHFEIETLLNSDDEAPSEVREHLDSCDTCLTRMQQVLIGGNREGAKTATEDAQGSVGPESPPNVPGYVFEQVIGFGGMGSVWKAVQQSPRRTVAVKFIRGKSTDRAALDRMKQEADAAARLQHQNVVTLYEFREDPIAGPFLTMEYVPGGTLADRMQAGPCDPVKACELVRCLAEAVGFANSRNVIHRDLKPTNILLAEDGTPKISDFGIARLQDEESASKAEIIGTPHYMAPEQARGEPVDGRADVYSLGVILFEMVTGQTPFIGDTVAAVLLSVQRTEPPRAGRLRAGIPKAVETICEKCLQRDPDRRYASAFELAVDLDRFLTGRPILAMPVSRLYRCFMWVKRNKSKAAALALAACILIVFSPLAISLWLTAENESQKRSTAESNRKTAQDYASAAILVQPSEDDFDPVQKKVRLQTPWFKPIERTLDDLKKFQPTLGENNNTKAIGWLILVTEAKQAAMLGNWDKANEKYKQTSIEINRMSTSPDPFAGKDYLRILHAQLLVERSVILRNLEQFEQAEESARTALLELNAAGDIGDQIERKRLRRDGLLEQLRSLRFMSQHEKASKVSPEVVRLSEELAQSPGETEDVSFLGQCLLHCSQQPGPNTSKKVIKDFAERSLSAHLRVHRSYRTLLQPTYQTAEAYVHLSRVCKNDGDLDEALKNAQLAKETLALLQSSSSDYSEIPHLELAILILFSQIHHLNGDNQKSLQYAAESVKKVEALLKESSASTFIRTDSAEAYYSLADAQARNNLLAESEASLVRVIQDLGLLSDVAKSKPLAVLATANARLELAELRRKMGRLEASQQAAQEALKALKKWLDSTLASSDDRRNILSPLQRMILPNPLLSPPQQVTAADLFLALATECNRNGSLQDKADVFLATASLLRGISLIAVNRHDDAYQQIGESVRRLDSFAKKSISDPEDLRALGRIYHFNARSFQRLGRTSEWAETDRKAIAIRRTLCKLRPNDFDSGDALAYSLGLLGDSLFPYGGQEGQDAYSEAIKIWDDLEDRHPKASVTQVDRAIVLDRLAHYQIEYDQFEQAEKTLNLASQHHLLGKEKEPKAENLQSGLIGHHFHFARLRAKQGDHAGCHENVTELIKAGGRQKMPNFEAAVLLCWCSKIAEEDSKLTPEERTKLSLQFSNEAVERLGISIEAGYDNSTSIESNSLLRRLSERADFQRVMKQLKSKK
jgi:tetratricopeptide (TPR) repeat protein